MSTIIKNHFKKMLFLLILIYPFDAFCIYDQIALDIKVKDGKIAISFTPDYNQNIKKFTALYVAALIGNDIYFFYKNQGNLALEKLIPGIEPHFFTDEYSTEAVLLPQLDLQLINNIQLFAGTGSSLTDMVSNGSIVCFYDGQPPQLPQPKRKWTVMVYMVGSNLEGETGSKKRNATNDIMQMIQGTAVINPDTANVVLTTGGSTRKGWESVKRSWIHNGQYHHIEDMGNLNMGNPDTLSSFVIWSEKQFPAEHYALVMWSHGNGTKGFGKDVNYAGAEGTLVFSRLNKAFTDIRDEISTPLDILLYDACLMGTIEVAQLVSGIAGVMGASADTEPGSGFDYHALLQGIETRSISNGIDFGKNALDAYILECSNSGKLEGTGTTITYSILDLAKLDAFNQEFGVLSEYLLDIMTEKASETYENLSKGLIQTTSYPLGSLTGVIDSSVKYFPVDLVGFFDNISERIPDLSYAAQRLTDIILGEPAEEVFQKNSPDSVNKIKNRSESSFKGGLVAYYQGNMDLLGGISKRAGRISIDVGRNEDYIKISDDSFTTMILPQAYDTMKQAMRAYYTKRDFDTSEIDDTLTCPNTGESCAAGPNWLELSLDDDGIINVNVLLCQSIDGGEFSPREILSSRQIYNGAGINNVREEHPVLQEDLCSYSLCMDNLCELITVRDIGNNILTAEAVVNGLQTILTFTRTDTDQEGWHISSVTEYSDDTWGKSEGIITGDIISPISSRLVDGSITNHSGISLNVTDSSKLVLRKDCDIAFPAVAASFSGYNGVIQYKDLCYDGRSCFSSANEEPYPAIVITE